MPRSTATEFHGAPTQKRIDMAVLQALDHVGRRQHDEAHILVGIDAARRHPEAQMIVVRRERERHAEGERLVAAAPCDLLHQTRELLSGRTPSDRSGRDPRPRSFRGMLG